jgi:hypothetical protein
MCHRVIKRGLQGQQRDAICTQGGGGCCCQLASLLLLNSLNSCEASVQYRARNVMDESTLIASSASGGG